MKTITEIRLYMENCDVITLPIESVSLLEFNGLDVLHTDVPSGTKYPDIKICFYVKYEYMSWYTDTDEDRMWYSYLFSSNRYNLVSIDFHFEDGSMDTYSLPWEDGDDDYTNHLDKLTRLPDGQVFIEILKRPIS